MASLRMRWRQPCYLLLGLVGISFVLYSSYSPPVHYIERQDYGQNSSRLSVHQLSELDAPVSPDKTPPSSQWEEPTLTVASLSVAASHPIVASLTPSSNAANTVTNHDSTSSNSPKSKPVVAEDSSPGAATSAREQWEQKTPKKEEQAPLVTHSSSSAPDDTSSLSDPMARGVITSTLYDKGHDIPASQLCPDAGSGMNLMILVTSAPRHADARMAIRQTWGHFGIRRDMSVGFFIATSKDVETQRALEGESALYGDIIRANFVDSYVNLTLKTISMFEWVDTYCSHVRFLLKTDDDMFINVPRLLSFIRKHSGDKRTIYGRLAKKWKPIRNKNSKYYVSSQQYKPAVFPDFTTGPAYLLTSDTTHDMYVTALNKTYLHLEDVFATGIVAQDIKIMRVHANEFMNKRISFNACNIQKGISIHMVKFPEQFDLWKKLLDGRTKCK